VLRFLGCRAKTINDIETKGIIMRLLKVCLILVAASSGAAIAQEGTTYFKSEVAGKDLPFSDAALVGNTLYISGKGGFTPGTRSVPENPREEARLLMEDFKVTLERAEMTMDNLVYVTVYCTDLSLYPLFNEVYRKYFSKDFPPRAFVGSGPLLFGLRFEMQGIAVKD